MTRSILTAGALALAIACAGAQGPRWEKPGGSDDQLLRDQDDCMSRATTLEDPGSIDPQARARVSRDFEDCMYSRGWKRIKAGGGPP